MPDYPRFLVDFQRRFPGETPSTAMRSSRDRPIVQAPPAVATDRRSLPRGRGDLVEQPGVGAKDEGRAVPHAPFVPPVTTFLLCAVGADPLGVLEGAPVAWRGFLRVDAEMR